MTDRKNQLAERFGRLETMLAEGRVIRNNWTDTDAGRERACLLAAISPEVGSEQSAAACPAWLLPSWFAELTPAMDDNGSSEAWPGMVSRYAAVVRRAAETLTAEQWGRLLHRTLAICVREAVSRAKNETATRACQTVIKLCDRAGRGEAINESEWRAAAEAATDAAWAATDAAWAAACAARPAWAAAGAARTAWVAAWDRMTAAILDAIEAECNG